MVMCARPGCVFEAAPDVPCCVVHLRSQGETCPRCAGSGYSGKASPCARCNGVGVLDLKKRTAPKLGRDRKSSEVDHCGLILASERRDDR